MEDNPKLMESLVDKAKDYGQSGLILIKLKALDKSSDVLSSAFSNAFAPAIICVFLFFANIGLAIWIGEELESLNAGFFIVAAFYLVLAIFVYLFLRKWIKRRIQNLIITNVLK